MADFIVCDEKNNIISVYIKGKNIN
ncbi:MAG: hypothetical protein IJA60_05160 [Clostridia bacterium]|nr:hypothetical protein [Clostridia bacterium]